MYCNIDLDYIYFCELVGVCGIFDYGDIEITSLNKGEVRSMQQQLLEHIGVCISV